MNSNHIVDFLADFYDIVPINEYIDKFKQLYQASATYRYDYFDELNHCCDRVVWRYGELYTDYKNALIENYIHMTMKLPINPNSDKNIFAYNQLLEGPIYFSYLDDNDIELLFGLYIDEFEHNLLILLVQNMKLTDRHYRIIINASYEDEYLINKMLNICANNGFYPNEDDIYMFIQRGINIDQRFLTYIDTNSAEYIASLIRGGFYNIRANRKTIYDFNDDEMELIKEAIEESYNEENLKINKNMKPSDLKTLKRIFKID